MFKRLMKGLAKLAEGRPAMQTAGASGFAGGLPAAPAGADRTLAGGSVFVYTFRGGPASSCL